MTPNYTQGMASQEFMYHNCAKSNIIFFEELKITPGVVNDLKRALEGSETCTNRKFGDMSFICYVLLLWHLVIMTRGGLYLERNKHYSKE